MSSKTNIATGLIITAIGALISLSEFEHAIFLTGLLISVGGLGQIVDTLNKNE